MGVIPPVGTLFVNPHSSFSLENHYRKADRIMFGVLWLMFAYSLALAA